MAAAGILINDLPDSLLLQIFSYLEQVELHLSVSRVCKRWESVCYDRELWSHFDQEEYDKSFNGVVDTTNLQYHLFQKVHSFIKHLYISKREPEVLPSLSEADWHGLQQLFLSCNHGTEIQMSSKVYIKEYLSHKYCDTMECRGEFIYVDKSYILDVETGDNSCSLRPKWTDIARQLHEDPCDRSVTMSVNKEFEIPTDIFTQLADMKNLQHLHLIRLDCPNIENLSEPVIDQLCRNLQSLTTYYGKHMQCPSHYRPQSHVFMLIRHLNSLRSNVRSNNISNLLSHAASLKYLHLDNVMARCLSVVPVSCYELTELHLSYIRRPGNTCYLCEIAYHCTNLKKLISFCCDLKFYMLLHVLSEKCKQLSYQDIKKARIRVDDTTKGHDILCKLMLCCTKLKTLYLTSITDILEICEVDYVENIALEGLRLGKGKYIFETVGSMKRLTELILFSTDEISREFLRELSKTCINLAHLELREATVRILEIHKERGARLLHEINLQKLKYLALFISDSYFPAKQIWELTERARFLETMNLSPLQNVQELKIMIGDRPYRLIEKDVECYLKLLSLIRWKQVKDGWFNSETKEWY